MGATLKRVAGIAHTNHPLYQTWYGMRERCGNPAHTSYGRYGGRGIRVCARWSDFAAFVEDVGAKPLPHLSLDRFPNPDGNYEPGNVRWADAGMQARNKAGAPFVERTKAHETTGARRLLTEWIARVGNSQTKIAAALGVRQSSVSLWSVGRSRPEHHYRVAIMRLVSIPVDEWMTDDEYVIAYGIARQTEPTAA